MKIRGLVLTTLIALVGLIVGIWFSPDPAEAKGKKAKVTAPPAEGTAAAEEVSGREVLHMVRAGEELHMLAGYYYNDCRQWPRIYRYNRERIKNPNLIYAGAILSVAVPEDWQPYMPYEEFFAKATAGGAPVKAAEAAPAKTAEEKKL